MKSEHYDKVKKCKKYKEGNCSFYENCWFKHEEVDKEEKEKEKDVKNENNVEMMKKLFEIVEKFTKRIVDVEEIVKNVETKNN